MFLGLIVVTVIRVVWGLFLSSNPVSGKLTGPSSREKEAVEDREGEMHSLSFVLTHSSSLFLEAPASS